MDGKLHGRSASFRSRSCFAYVVSTGLSISLTFILGLALLTLTPADSLLIPESSDRIIYLLCVVAAVPFLCAPAGILFISGLFRPRRSAYRSDASRVPGPIASDG